MKKKRTVIIFVVVFMLIAVLFAPIPQGQLRDGGTEVFSALTYKIVKWRRISPIRFEDDQMEDIYENTSVFWFPDHMKSIDELWEIESNQ